MFGILMMSISISSEVATTFALTDTTTFTTSAATTTTSTAASAITF